MKIQESAENYLETILVLQKRIGNVRAVDIATELEFSKPSVSVAMKKLRQNGYINVNELGEISLTTEGTTIASQMYERHKFLSSFLISIGVERKVALNDACRLEHFISQQSFDRLREFAESYLLHTDNE